MCDGDKEEIRFLLEQESVCARLVEVALQPTAIWSLVRAGTNESSCTLGNGR